ncbi:GNAT family N-acetyltransferase [Streptomyces sp. NPDC052496]|uniref:GNAT family N-acetyltransferase n=1 Tax=Streptomyces sp. NPDC052496 TaxID=3154951 RepID=UPI003432C834
MKNNSTAGLLAALDEERRASGTADPDSGVVRETAPDGSECRIVFARCTEQDAGSVLRAETARADALGHVLEWKLYGHDVPAGMGSRLRAAGFVPEEEEKVLVLPVSEGAAAAFEAPAYDIRRAGDARGLDDVAEISRDLGRRNVEEERRRLELSLRDAPGEMSVHVAYVDGVPAACGRVYYRPGGAFAELAGGRTRPAYRKRGLFTALVAARLREAVARGRTHAVVDALPTSEPTLTKRGFVCVTTTRPFVYEPGARAE